MLTTFNIFGSLSCLYVRVRLGSGYLAIFSSNSPPDSVPWRRGCDRMAALLAGWGGGRGFFLRGSFSSKLLHRATGGSFPITAMKPSLQFFQHPRAPLRTPQRQQRPDIRVWSLRIPASSLCCPSHGVVPASHSCCLLDTQESSFYPFSS